MALSVVIIFRMIATTMIESICLILRDHEDGDTIKMLVDELLYLYCTGISEKIKQHSQS